MGVSAGAEAGSGAASQNSSTAVETTGVPGAGISAQPFYAGVNTPAAEDANQLREEQAVNHEKRVKRRMRFSFLSGFNTTMVAGTLLFCLGVLQMNTHEDHAQKLLIQEAHHQKHLREGHSAGKVGAKPKEKEVDGAGAAATTDNSSGGGSTVGTSRGRSEEKVGAGHGGAGESSSAAVSDKANRGAKDGAMKTASVGDASGQSVGSGDNVSARSQGDVEGVRTGAGHDHDDGESEKDPSRAVDKDQKRFLPKSTEGGAGAEERVSGPTGAATTPSDESGETSAATKKQQLRSEPSNVASGNSEDAGKVKTIGDAGSVSVVIKQGKARDGAQTSGKASEDAGETVLVIHSGNSKGKAAATTEGGARRQGVPAVDAGATEAGSAGALGDAQRTSQWSSSRKEPEQTSAVPAGSGESEGDKKDGDIVVSIRTTNAKQSKEREQNNAGMGDESFRAAQSSSTSATADHGEGSARVGALAAPAADEKAETTQEGASKDESASAPIVVVGQDEVTVKIGGARTSAKEADEVPKKPPSGTGSSSSTSPTSGSGADATPVGVSGERLQETEVTRLENAPPVGAGGSTESAPRAEHSEQEGSRAVGAVVEELVQANSPAPSTDSTPATIPPSSPAAAGALGATDLSVRSPAAGAGAEDEHHKDTAAASGTTPSAPNTGGVSISIAAPGSRSASGENYAKSTSEGSAASSQDLHLEGEKEISISIRTKKPAAEDEISKPTGEASKSNLRGSVRGTSAAPTADKDKIQADGAAPGLVLGSAATGASPAEDGAVEEKAANKPEADGQTQMGGMKKVLSGIPLSWLQLRSSPGITSIEKEAAISSTTAASTNAASTSGTGAGAGAEKESDTDNMLDSIPRIVVTSKAQIFSYLGITVNIFVYIVPCAQLLDVVETGDVDLFPVPLLTVAGLVSNALWAEYSLKIHSIPYLIPNLIGVIFNFLQITVLCYFLWGRNPNGRLGVVGPVGKSLAGGGGLLEYKLGSAAAGGSSPYANVANGGNVKAQTAQLLAAKGAVGSPDGQLNGFGQVL
mmetsp:Transcript_13561/g.33315  ORF Transcript_13561/g.33315 Transcript_13561/m.33315 type:complete len:1037 (+) Transcript_13561:5116-8226(+)